MCTCVPEFVGAGVAPTCMCACPQTRTRSAVYIHAHACVHAATRVPWHERMQLCVHTRVSPCTCAWVRARVCVLWISGMEAERAGVFVALRCVFPGKLFLTLAALQTASLSTASGLGKIHVNASLSSSFICQIPAILLESISQPKQPQGTTTKKRNELGVSEKCAAWMGCLQTDGRAAPWRGLCQCPLS